MGDHPIISENREENQMLVPAILFKDQITSEFQRIYYTEDMMYLTGCLEQWSPDISTNPEEGKFDFAIVSNDKLIGYLSYRIDYYCSKAYNFGLLSFDRGNPVVGEELFNKMEELTKRLRKIEWRMVGGNPVEKHYDKFCKKHGGRKHNMQNKYSRKQLEELYNCKIFKTTTCNEDNYVFWAAQGLPFTENGEDRLFGDACGWDLDELHEDIRNAIRETCIVFDA